MVALLLVICRSHSRGERSGRRRLVETIAWHEGKRRGSARPDYIDRYLHRNRRPSVLKPVSGVLILRPAESRSIFRGHAIPMVSNRALEYVDHARPVFMVVNRAEDASRLDG